MEIASATYGVEPKVIAQKWSLRRLQWMTGQTRKRRDDERRWLLEAIRLPHMEKPQEHYDNLLSLLGDSEAAEEARLSRIPAMETLEPMAAAQWRAKTVIVKD